MNYDFTYPIAAGKIFKVRLQYMQYMLGRARPRMRHHAARHPPRGASAWRPECVQLPRSPSSPRTGPLPPTPHPSLQAAPAQKGELSEADIVSQYLLPPVSPTFPDNSTTNSTAFWSGTQGLAGFFTLGNSSEALANRLPRCYSSAAAEATGCPKAAAQAEAAKKLGAELELIGAAIEAREEATKDSLPQYTLLVPKNLVGGWGGSGAAAGQRRGGQGAGAGAAGQCPPHHRQLVRPTPPPTTRSRAPPPFECLRHAAAVQHACDAGRRCLATPTGQVRACWAAEPRRQVSALPHEQQRVGAALTRKQQAGAGGCM